MNCFYKFNVLSNSEAFKEILRNVLILTFNNHQFVAVRSWARLNLAYSLQRSSAALESIETRRLIVRYMLSLVAKKSAGYKTKSQFDGTTEILFPHFLLEERGGVPFVIVVVSAGDRDLSKKNISPRPTGRTHKLLKGGVKHLFLLPSLINDSRCRIEILLSFSLSRLY